MIKTIKDILAYVPIVPRTFYWWLVCPIRSAQELKLDSPAERLKARSYFLLSALFVLALAIPAKPISIDLTVYLIVMCTHLIVLLTLITVVVFVSLLLIRRHVPINHIFTLICYWSGTSIYFMAIAILVSSALLVSHDQPLDQHYYLLEMSPPMREANRVELAPVWEYFKLSENGLELVSSAVTKKSYGLYWVANRFGLDAKITIYVIAYTLLFLSVIYMTFWQMAALAFLRKVTGTSRLRFLVFYISLIIIGTVAAEFGNVYLYIVKHYFDLLAPSGLALSHKITKNEDVIARTSQAWSLCFVAMFYFIALIAIITRPLRIYRWMCANSWKSRIVVFVLALAILLGTWWSISYLTYQTKRAKARSNPFYPYLLLKKNRIIETGHTFHASGWNNVYVLLNDSDVDLLDKQTAVVLLKFAILSYSDWSEYEGIRVCLVRRKNTDDVIAVAIQEKGEKIQFGFHNIPND